ncbi:MAG: portal protein [Candidatus Thioglobus sp.]|nr:portal protein [Candidatus Thioglobus sp.]
MAVEQILKRLESLEAQKTVWNSHWQEILDYVMPRKAEVSVQYAKGTKRTEKLFDSTAIHANTLLAASLQGTLTSASLPWFHLRTRDEDLNKDRNVQVWLEDCRNRMYKAFNSSNFNTEVHEFYLDICSIGTSCIEVEEAEDGLSFRSLHISEYFVTENHKGGIDTIYRKFEYTARQAYQRWGDALGTKVMDSYKNEPDKKYTFIHAVMPAEDYSGEYDSKLPFVSIYVCKEDKNIVHTGGYNELPYLVTRWSKASGEEYGRSPAYNALPDIKTLNKAVELGLKAWAKAIDPPLLVEDDGVLGRVLTKPGGITVVRRDGAIKPLNTGARFDVSDLKESELRGSIKQAFYSDQLELQSGPQMTATEVQVRYELMQRLLGPTLGRFQTEFLNPLIERCFAIMQRQDMFLPAPEELEGVAIDIEYVGPLARSQRMEEAVAVERLYEMAATLSQIAPEIMDNLDHDEAIRSRASLLGVPKNIMKDPRQIAEMREQRQAEMQKQQEMAQMQQTVGMAGQAAQMSEQVNPENVESTEAGIEQMMQAMQ